MRLFRYVLSARRISVGVASVAAVGLLVALPGSAQAAAIPVPLGTADSFVVLAGAGITNTGPTSVHGDLGTFPTTSISGAGSMTVTGTNHAGDAVTQRAKTDLVTAYNTAAGEGPTSPIAADLTGRTLTRGVYNSASSILLTGALTLDAKGDPNAVFVFQAGSSLTTKSGSQVLLRNGARSCNVFWQVGSSATLGTGSKFVGTIMAYQSITVTTGAKIVGRALARNGAVTLDTNVITRPTSCVASSTGTTSGSQVTQLPAGAVSAGDGSTSGGANDGLGLLAGVLVFAGVGGAAVVATRRRRRVHT
ncbi:MAG TPA: ice-binding family protein [Dermatophilaceae bacterium]